MRKLCFLVGAVGLMACGAESSDPASVDAAATNLVVGQNTVNSATREPSIAGDDEKCLIDAPIKLEPANDPVIQKYVFNSDRKAYILWDRIDKAAGQMIKGTEVKVTNNRICVRARDLPPAAAMINGNLAIGVIVGVLSQHDFMEIADKDAGYVFNNATLRDYYCSFAFYQRLIYRTDGGQAGSFRNWESKFPQNQMSCGKLDLSEYPLTYKSVDRVDCSQGLNFEPSCV